jgi:hypothetical protein
MTETGFSSTRWENLWSCSTCNLQHMSSGCSMRLYLNRKFASSWSTYQNPSQSSIVSSLCKAYQKFTSLEFATETSHQATSDWVKMEFWNTLILGFPNFCSKALIPKTVWPGATDRLRYFSGTASTQTRLTYGRLAVSSTNFTRAKYCSQARRT